MASGRVTGWRAALILLLALLPECGVMAASGGSAEPDAASALAVENAALRRRAAKQESELRELRLKLQKSDAALRQLRIWLATTAANGTMLSPERREERLTRQMAAVIRSGVDLTLKTDAAITEIRKVSDRLADSPGEKAQLELRLDELSGAMRRFNAVTVGVETPRIDRCRVLAVDADLDIAVLSVGTAQGAFSGMIYHTNGVELKLIGVRPYAAAAVAVNGQLRSLVPGMEAVIGKNGKPAPPPGLFL